MPGTDNTTPRSPSPSLVTGASEGQQPANDLSGHQWQHRPPSEASVTFEEFRRNLETGMARPQFVGPDREYLFESPRRLSVDSSLSSQSESFPFNQSRQSSLGTSGWLAALRLQSRTPTRENTAESPRRASLPANESLLESSPTADWKLVRGFLEARNVDMASLEWIEHVRPKPGHLVQQFVNDLKDGLLPAKGHDHIPGMRGVLHIPLADPNADKITYQFANSGGKWVLVEIEFDRKIKEGRQTLRFNARDVVVNAAPDAIVPALPQEVLAMIAGETTRQGRAHMRLTSKSWKTAAETGMAGLVAHGKNGLDLIKEFPAFRTLQRLKVTGDDVRAEYLQDLSTHLEELDLSGCLNITDLSFVPASVRRLSLAGNQQIVDLSALGALANLEDIDLSGCHNIKGSSLASLPATVCKVSLAGHNRLRGIDLVFLRTPNCVRDLNLSATPVSDQDIGLLPPYVEHLDLRNCPNITDGVFPLLPANLQSIDVRGCDIDGQSFQQLPQTLLELSMTAVCFAENRDLVVNVTNSDLPQLPRGLESLCLETDHGYGPEIDDDGIPHLPQGLQTLKLSTCAISSRGLAHLPPRLTTLGLSNCPEIDAAAIRDLPASVRTSLRELDLSYCSNIDDNAVEFFPRDLKKVNLDFCGQVTDVGLAHLPAGVESLSVSSCRFTNEALPTLPKSVRELNISLSPQITDEGLARIPSGVERLDISFNLLITGAGLDNLPKSVRRINAYRCPAIGEGDVSRLRQRGVEVVRVRP